MNPTTWNTLGILAILAAPMPTFAQIAPAIVDARSPGGCCGEMQQPPPQFQCTSLRPALQTHWQARDVTALVNVTETQLRTETYVEQVPVTTIETVTVDAGGYQTVWVPKLVTKQVPRTQITQQLKTRTVPTQVTRQIPQTVTQLVPIQPVQPVPRSLPLTAPAPVVTLGRPDFAASPTPISAGTAAPVWQPIPQRKASSTSDRLEKKTPPPLDDPAPLQRKTSAVQPSVPTAATVWNARPHGGVHTSGAMVGFRD
jgi:hypothetical protein